MGDWESKGSRRKLIKIMHLMFSERLMSVYETVVSIKVVARSGVSRLIDSRGGQGYSKQIRQRRCWVVGKIIEAKENCYSYRNVVVSSNIGRSVGLKNKLQKTFSEALLVE